MDKPTKHPATPSLAGHRVQTHASNLRTLVLLPEARRLLTDEAGHRIVGYHTGLQLSATCCPQAWRPWPSTRSGLWTRTRLGSSGSSPSGTPVTPTVLRGDSLLFLFGASLFTLTSCRVEICHVTGLAPLPRLPPRAQVGRMKFEFLSTGVISPKQRSDLARDKSGTVPKPV